MLSGKHAVVATLARAWTGAIRTVRKQLRHVDVEIHPPTGRVGPLRAGEGNR